MSCARSCATSPRCWSSDGDPARGAAGEAGLHHRDARCPLVAAGARARRAHVHHDLGRRPHRRAARRVRGTAARRPRRARAPRRRTRRRQRGVGVRGPGAAQRRVQRGGRAAGQRVQLRADPLRPDASRRVGHRRPHRRHGPQRRVRVAVLPVVPARLRRSASATAHRRSRPRAGVRAGVERLGDRGVGRLRARPHDPAADPVPARSRGRRRRGAPQRRAWVQGDDVLGGAAHARAAVAAHPTLGPAHGGVRGDRDRRVPARRVVGHVAGDRTRRAVRHHRRAVLRVRDVRRRRLALLAHPGALPRAAHLPLRGRHRLGRGVARPARARAQVRRDVRHVERRRAEPGRHVPPQLLGVRDRRPVGVPAARRDRGRQHPGRVRLPARRLHVAAHPGAARRAARRLVRPRGRAGHVGERVGPVPPPGAARSVQRDPNAY